jgi:hypothetical protein
MNTSWECALCGKQHEYIPDLNRGVHYPTREAAARMGYRVSPARTRPKVATAEILQQMISASIAARHRAAVCTKEGLDDLAGAWTRTAADLESTVGWEPSEPEPEPVPAQIDPVPALATGIMNMFTGKMEAPHEPPKKKRGRR